MHSRNTPLPDEIIRTRKDAANLGMDKYYTGKPCSRGHVALRNTRTGACCHCLRVYAQEYREATTPRNDGLHEVTVRIPPLAAGALADFVAALVLAHELDRLAHEG